MRSKLCLSPIIQIAVDRVVSWGHVFNFVKY